MDDIGMFDVAVWGSSDFARLDAYALCAVVTDHTYDGIWFEVHTLKGLALDDDGGPWRHHDPESICLCDGCLTGGRDA